MTKNAEKQDTQAAAGAVQLPTPGRIVTLTVPGPGVEGVAEVAAVIAKVNDDGSINARAFSPNGGADPFFTGLKSKADHDALAEDDPGRHLASWDWPARA